MYMWLNFEIVLKGLYLCMIKIVKVLHHYYFCKTFFRYKILIPIVKLNVALVAQMHIIHNRERHGIANLVKHYIL